SRLWLLGQRRIDPIGSGGNGRDGNDNRESQDREEPTERQHGKVFLPGQPEKASRGSGGCDKPAPPPGKATPGAGSEGTGTTDPRQSTPQGTSPVPLIFASNVAPGRLVAHERLRQSRALPRKARAHGCIPLAVEQSWARLSGLDGFPARGFAQPK